MNSYAEMSRECEQQAEELKKTIDKYKSKSKTSRNREEINAKICNLELIYHELIGRANYLREVAERK